MQKVFTEILVIIFIISGVVLSRAETLTVHYLKISYNYNIPTISLQLACHVYMFHKIHQL